MGKSYLSLFGRFELVEPEVVAVVLVELAVQLAAVGTPVVLADEPLVPHRVADDAGLFDEDLLLEPVDHLLPTAGLDVIVEDDHAVRMWLAPDHHDLTPALVVRVDDRPRLSALAAVAAHQPQLRPELLRGLALRLVVLGLRLLESAPHAQQVVAEAVVGGKELRLLLGRTDQPLESVLEGRLDSFLAVGDVRRPAF